MQILCIFHHFFCKIIIFPGRIKKKYFLLKKIKKNRNNNNNLSLRIINLCRFVPKIRYERQEHMSSRCE